MNCEDAIRLVRNMVSAEVEIMKQIQRRGTQGKGATDRERKAAIAIFTALTGGTKPTEDEIQNMIGY